MNEGWVVRAHHRSIECITVSVMTSLRNDKGLIDTPGFDCGPSKRLADWPKGQIHLHLFFVFVLIKIF